MQTKKDGQTPKTTMEGLLDRRTVALVGHITPSSIAETMRELLTLQTLSPAPINLIIDSGGGSTYDALRLCDFISVVMTAPVRGIAIGMCGSAATFIMLHCNERLSTPYTQFLIHSGTRSQIQIPINQSTSENLEQLLSDARRTEEIVLRLYMNRLTPPAWAKKRPTEKVRREYVQKLIGRGDQRFDELMTSDEAVEIGLVTKIISGKLDIFSK